MVRWFFKHSTFRCIFTAVVLAGLTVAAWLLSCELSLRRGKQLLSAAQSSFEHGDFRNAVVTCRQLLQRNPNSPDACRLMIAINEQANSPQAIAWALKLADFSQNDPEVLTKLAALGLKFGEIAVAKDALNRLPTPAKKSASTLSIQAIIAITAGQLEKAESLFERAARLEPSNLKWRLDLLKLRLQFRDPAHVDSARKELEMLSKDPGVKSDALRALLEDARSQSKPLRALLLAEELASVPNAPLSDKLAFLEELQEASIEQFSVKLAELQRTIGSSGNPELISQAMSWQNSRGLCRESLKWAEQLPHALAQRVPIQMAQSDALMGLGEWVKLLTRVAGADWGGMNYLRLAIYARAKQALGESDFRQGWESAIAATAGDWSALVSLEGLAERWGWSQQAVETLWLIARQSQGQRAALKKLYIIYERERNLAELYKVAKRYWEVCPQDPIAVNNVASLGLLLEKDTDEASKLAEKVYSEEPSVGAFAATYAFSLMRGHQAQKALKVLEKLPPAAMAEPSIDLCYGLALAATGQKDAGKSHLEAALRSGRLFPEEEALAHNALGGP